MSPTMEDVNLLNEENQQETGTSSHSELEGDNQLQVERDEADPHEDDGRNSWKRILDMRPFWVEPAFMLYQLALWSLIPLSNQFIFATVLTERSIANISNTDVAELHKAQKEAAQWILILEALRCVAGFFCGIVYLFYSKTTGRKLGLFLPCLGSGIKALTYMAVSATGVSLWYLSIGHLCEGLGGTQLTMGGSAHAYLADRVPQEKRTLRYIGLNISLLLGCTTGNIVVGYIIAYQGFEISFIYTIAAFLVGGFYIVLVLPESLQEERALEQSFSLMKVSSAKVKALTIFLKKRTLPQHAKLVLCLIILWFTTMILLGLVNVETLYLLGPPFNFSSISLGYFLAEVAVLNAVGPVLAILLLQRYCSDITVGILASISGIAGYLLFGLGYNNIMALTGMFQYSSCLKPSQIKLSSNCKGETFKCTVFRSLSQ